MTIIEEIDEVNTRDALDFYNKTLKIVQYFKDAALVYLKEVVGVDFEAEKTSEVDYKVKTDHLKTGVVVVEQYAYVVVKETDSGEYSLIPRVMESWEIDKSDLLCFLLDEDIHSESRNFSAFDYNDLSSTFNSDNYLDSLMSILREKVSHLEYADDPVERIGDVLVEYKHNNDHNFFFFSTADYYYCLTIYKHRGRTQGFVDMLTQYPVSLEDAFYLFMGLGCEKEVAQILYNRDSLRLD